MMVELIIASALTAAAAVVIFLFAATLSNRTAALAVALVFAFATPAWSIGSRALWMHGFSMLLLPAGLWAVWRGRWALAGALFALAFFARPTNVVGLGLAGALGDIVTYGGTSIMMGFALAGTRSAFEIGTAVFLAFLPSLVALVVLEVIFTVGLFNFVRERRPDLAERMGLPVAEVTSH
mgnify:CR=1 FL=1